MNKYNPTIRLHLWLETDNGLFFGSGRAQLLKNIDKYGSLKKAAENMKMSYRAAWGKVKKTEEVLGIELITKTGTNRDGYQLTEFGKEFMEKFQTWFDRVEKSALKEAEQIFSWSLKTYKDKL
ncbi:MAG: molybdate transport system regulatory protein [Desulfobacteraceae bacterium Eth-SRB1]|nr:MAG: molybdate transport system regulatory protein [Desulfobacteraceae bacterium Eth-SRB1]